MNERNPGTEKHLEIKRLQRNALRGDQQFTGECCLGGAATESLLGGETREMRIVVFLRNVREYQVTRARIKAFGIGQILADSMIREMSRAGKNSLLYDPGIRTDFQHIQVVIGFENEAIGLAQVHFDEFRQVAEVRADGYLGAIGAKREADRIGSIMRNSECVNVD